MTLDSTKRGLQKVLIGEPVGQISNAVYLFKNMEAMFKVRDKSGTANLKGKEMFESEGKKDDVRGIINKTLTTV